MFDDCSCLAGELANWRAIKPMRYWLLCRFYYYRFDRPYSGTNKREKWYQLCVCAHEICNTNATQLRQFCFVLQFFGLRLMNSGWCLNTSTKIPELYYKMNGGKFNSVRYNEAKYLRACAVCAEYLWMHDTCPVGCKRHIQGYSANDYFYS